MSCFHHLVKISKMKPNNTARGGFMYCSKTEDCTDKDAVCTYHTDASASVCYCSYHLEPTGPDGKCEYLTNYKKCEVNKDCGADLVCLENRDGLKTCHCVHSLKQSDKHGNCSHDGLISEEGENDGVINIHSIQAGLNPDNCTTNTTEQLPLPMKEPTEQQALQVLQIFLPISFALLIVFVIALIFLRRSRFCRKRKSRKELVVRSSEDVQLLDRMNFVNKNPAYYMTLTGKKFPIKEIEADKVKIIEVVGEGAFGHVYKGLLYQPNEDAKDVAVKVLKEGVSNEVREDFEREVEIMSSFDHDNILRLLGVVTKGCGESPYMIFEYMEHGDLAELLRRNDPAMRKNDQVFKLQKTHLIDIALQIATGMTYLTSQHFVHRDLATRNCLVGNQLVVKISDFGMARDIYTCDYYKIGGSRMLPVRWMSPESIKYGHFTTESDIWAFGVVLWEIFSFGRQPYYGHANEEVIKFLEEGILLQRPEECPSTVYHIMLGCWKSDPKERLPFSRISKHITDFSNDVMKNNREIKEDSPDDLQI